MKTKLSLLITLTIVVIASACNGTAGGTIPTSSLYVVRVEDAATNKGIYNAKVIVQAISIGKISDVADTDGYARLFIPTEYVGKPGRLIVEVEGYKAYRSEINLYVDQLPTRVLLERVDASILPSGAPSIVSSTPLTETETPPDATSTAAPTFTAISDTPTPTELLGKITDRKGVEMALIPAGEFLMGSTDADSMANPDQKPQHRVYLDDYYIDLTEVTNAMYAACVQADGCTPPGSVSSHTRNSYYGAAQYDNYPVIYVNWEQARTYCAWRGGSLPTEAQWEKAARGTDGRLYPWGNEFDGSRANFCDKNCSLDWANKAWDDGYADTAPVGSYPAGTSPYGLLDMAGNVWEWVKDWYQADFYAISPRQNPAGPVSGETRVLRSGGWNNGEDGMRAALRFRDDPSLRGDNVGFRCAHTP